MWILKGVLLGFAIFIVGTLAYAGLGVGIGMYKLAKTVKAGTTQDEIGLAGIGISVDLHNPILWVALFLSIVIGLWIMRAKGVRREGMQ